MSARRMLRCSLVLVVLGAGRRLTRPMSRVAAPLAQVSCLVTRLGLFRAKLIPAESHSPLIRLSLVLKVIGLYLVQPRRKPVLAGT